MKDYMTTVSIGENVKTIRELKNYSQEFMALKLKISQSTYSRIESGKNKIDDKLLSHLSEIFEIDEDVIRDFNKDDKLLFENKQQHKNEYEEIEYLLSALNTKIKLDDSLTYLSQEGFTKIYNQFKLLDTSVFNHQKTSIDTNDRLHELTDLMSSYANFDFSRKPEVKEEYNHLDYIAISLNLMRDRQEERYNSISLAKIGLDHLNHSCLITDKFGVIKYANNVFFDSYKIKKEEVHDISIKALFEKKVFKDYYHISFDLNTEMHHVSLLFTI